MRSTGRRRIDASPSTRHARPVLRGEPAGQQPHERAGVADVDRVGDLARLAQADAADDDLVVALLDERAERAHRVERRVRVGGVEVVVDAHRRRRSSRRAARRGARSTCRAARRPSPRRRSAGLEADVHARATGMPSPPISSSARVGVLVAADPERDAALPEVRRGAERHVHDVDTRAPERERDVGDHARAVGDHRPQLEDLGALQAGLEQRAAVGRGRVVPRASTAAAVAGRAARSRTVAQALDRLVDLLDERVAVGEVDVGPDRAVGAGDAGRVAEARAGRRDRLAAERARRLARRARWRARAAGARRSP